MGWRGSAGAVLAQCSGRLGLVDEACELLISRNRKRREGGEGEVTGKVKVLHEAFPSALLGRSGRSEHR